MAQTWTATKVQEGGLGPAVPAGSTLFQGLLLLSCSGPATSVSDGAAVSITSDLASKIIPIGPIARMAGSMNTAYKHEFKVSTGFDEANLKISTYRRSTGALLTSAVSLASEKLYFWVAQQGD